MNVSQIRTCIVTLTRFHLYVNTHHQCKHQQDQRTEFVLKKGDVKKGFVTIQSPSLSTFESYT